MSIVHSESIPHYPILEISHPTGSGRVALHGAHLMEWTPTGQHPLIYLSPEAIYHSGKAIRGGVPVCWPWFGPHPAEASFPAHGFARTRRWTLERSEESPTGVTLVLSLTDDAETRRWWPQAFRLEMRLCLGATIKLSLRMMNQDARTMTITAALHTYFVIGDIRNLPISGLDGASYLDTVGPPQVRTQVGDIRFNGEVDRIYASSNPVEIHDPVLARRITVQGQGSQSCVVWNPWIDKAKSLTDLPDEDYQRFVCVETTNAWEDRVTIPPGAEHTLAVTIGVNANA
jgi:glucose-6-phosphate 1-epimerase